MKLPHLSLTVSHPILHDIIKSFLMYDFKELFEVCSTLPKLKRSRIFLPTSPHKLYDAKQEWFVDGIKYPADAVWRFTSPYSIGVPSYYIVHEIKTGHYDLEKEMEKHYIHNNHVSLHIWAYPEYHKQNTYVPKSFVKMLDINSLKPYIVPKVTRIIEDWGWHTGESK